MPRLDRPGAVGDAAEDAVPSGRDELGGGLLRGRRGEGRRPAERRGGGGPGAVDLAHEVDEDGRTALHFAAYQSACGAAEAVISAVLRADVLQPFKERLHELRERTAELERSLVSEADHRLCAQWLQEERARLCLDFEVQCTATACNMLSRADRNGCTPLHYAATTRDDTLGDLLRFPHTFAQRTLARVDGLGGAPPGAKKGFIPAGVRGPSTFPVGAGIILHPGMDRATSSAAMMPSA